MPSSRRRRPKAPPKFGAVIDDRIDIVRGKDGSWLSVGPYAIRGVLGEGSYGVVYLVEFGDSLVALKVIARDQVDGGMMDKVRREIRLMKGLNHHHVVRLLNLMRSKKYIFLVLDYVAGGELYEAMVEMGSFAEPHARSTFAQLVLGVGYLHSRNIVHRDLKPENILVDADGRVLIADFGFANEVADGGLLRTSCGSPNYAAPEVINGQPYTGFEVDMWSLGVILYALLCGALPFPAHDIRDLYAQIRTANHRPFPAHVSTDAQHLVSSLLVVDQLARATIEDVIDHPWFRKGTSDLIRRNHREPWRATRSLQDLEEAAVRRVARERGSTFAAVSVQLGPVAIPRPTHQHSPPPASSGHPGIPKPPVETCAIRDSYREAWKEIGETWSRIYGCDLVAESEAMDAVMTVPVPVIPPLLEPTPPLLSSPLRSTSISSPNQPGVGKVVDSRKNSSPSRLKSPETMENNSRSAGGSGNGPGRVRSGSLSIHPTADSPAGNSEEPFGSVPVGEPPAEVTGSRKKKFLSWFRKDSVGSMPNAALSMGSIPSQPVSRSVYGRVGGGGVATGGAVGPGDPSVRVQRGFNVGGVPRSGGSDQQQPRMAPRPKPHPHAPLLRQTTDPGVTVGGGLPPPLGAPAISEPSHLAMSESSGVLRSMLNTSVMSPPGGLKATVHPHGSVTAAQTPMFAPFTKREGLGGQDSPSLLSAAATRSDLVKAPPSPGVHPMYGFSAERIPRKGKKWQLGLVTRLNLRDLLVELERSFRALKAKWNALSPYEFRVLLALPVHDPLLPAPRVEIGVHIFQDRKDRLVLDFCRQKGSTGLFFNACLRLHRELQLSSN